MEKASERAADFFRSAAFALIAANWAILNLKVKTITIAVNKDQSLLFRHLIDLPTTFAAAKFLKFVFQAPLYKSSTYKKAMI